MKKKITKRTNRKVKYLKSVDEIPDFKNIEEEVQFWKTHSIIDIIDQFPEVKLEISGELKRRIEEHKKKKLLTLRLDPEQIEKTKKIAVRKGIGYLTLMRNWIQEGIERDLVGKAHKKDILAEELNNFRKSIEESIKSIIEPIRQMEKFRASLLHELGHTIPPIIRGESLTQKRIPEPTSKFTNPLLSISKEERKSPQIHTSH